MDYINRFTEVLRIKNLQPNSVENYQAHLRHFLSWCYANLVTPEDVTHEGLLTYLALPCSNSTLRQRRAVVINFYTYVLNEGFKTYGIPNPKKSHSLPDYLSVFELQRVMATVKNTKHRTILKMQYACALRVHEVTKIKISDFKKVVHNGKPCWDLKIIGKGAKHRWVPVPDETMAEIFNYYKALPVKGEYLFAGQFKSWYSERSVQQVMNKALVSVGIKKKGESTHLLRHSRATHLIQAGVDVTFVQKLLGHTNVKTTMTYLHLNVSDLRTGITAADDKMKIDYNNKQIAA